MKTSKLALAALACCLAAPAADSPSIQSNTEFRVKLLAALSTETNKKGDKIAAQVLAPEQFAGGMMEGEIRESKSGGKITGKSVLTLGFKQLSRGDRIIPVQAQVKGFTNSKGQQNVDEEGRVVEKKSNVAKAAAATGIGALIGGLAGGAKGAAIGAGVGGAASLVLIQVAAKGANISFAPGSEILLSVSEGRKDSADEPAPARK